jgi:hydrogenase maturation protein HypF
MMVTHNESEGLWELDPVLLVTSLLQRRAAGVTVAQLADDFHDGLARGFIAMAAKARPVEEVDLLLFSGGVFSNARLTRVVAQAATGETFRAFFHKSYPPTDGGVAFGQAAAIAARLLTGSF